jgi:hypothetical protein
MDAASMDLASRQPKSGGGIMGENRQMTTRRQAILHGLPSYFTGEPCKYGHIADRGTRSRQCHECARIIQQRLQAAKPKLSEEDKLSRLPKNPFIMTMNHYHRVLLAIAGLGKINSILQTLECTRAELRSYIESHFQPGMSWENQGEWDIELHIPHTQFNLFDREQRQACFHHSNLRPIWINDHTRI